MKICQVCPYTAPAKDSQGAERMIEDLTKGLLELGHEVVMKLNPGSQIDFCELVDDIPKNCDIINFHGWDPDTSKLEYEKYDIPWVSTMHGGGTESSEKWLKSVIGNPHIIAVSKFIADRLSLKNYAWTCSNPADYDFNVKKDNYFLWMAGTDWGEAKGLWSTILIAKKLNINLVIAGSGKNQDNIELIKTHCNEKIKYVGSVNGQEKANLLTNAKALILLSQVPDACPRTVSESLMSGTPIIASNRGALPELIREDVGFVCGSQAETVKAIVNINKIRPKDCYEYGLKYFSHTIIAEKYLQFYQSMINFNK